MTPSTTAVIKAMYVFGEEMSVVDSNASYVAAALAKLDFFVMQEIFFSETCRFADVILPASPSLEKEGTFTNTERRIQRIYQAMEPLGDSRPDWRIVMDIANRLGAKWSYKHPAEIYEEIAALTPLMAGVTYERLEGFRSLHWPVAPDGSDEPLLYTKQFKTADGKAVVFPRDVDRAGKPARCDLRFASQQWAPAGAFPRRQHDLSHGRNPREGSMYLCGGFT